MVHQRAEYRGVPEPEQEQDGSLVSLCCAGVGLGSLSKIVQSRSIVQSARANAHYRGLAAALVGDASLAAQEAKQLWREDGFLMFVKWPALVVGLTVPFIVSSLCTQSLFDQALGVSEEDIEERTPSVHIRKVALVDRVIKRKDHFYSAWLASAAMGPMMHLSDVVRVKVLHWHKATFFPDFMPARDEHGDDDDIGSEGEHEAEEGEEEEPSTARRMAYGATTALVFAAACSLGAALLAPVETTVAAIYRQEGAWGFFHGLVPAIIAQCGMSFFAIETEADLGKASL